MIDKEQLQVLFEQFSVTQLTQEQFINMSTKQATDLLKYNDEQLLSFLEVANYLYRSGYPVIPDDSYDLLHADFIRRQPEHPFVTQVEPEPLLKLKTVPLPEKMLSTDKAYTQEEITRWLTRVEKSALELGIDFTELHFRVTPKLDGYAAFDDGEKLYTRGDGVRGQDISRVFELGLKVAGKDLHAQNEKIVDENRLTKNGLRGQGAGEIVISKEYFEAHLSEYFENSRNIQAALLAEKNVSPLIKEAVDAGAAVFFPFAQLPDWIGSALALNKDFDKIVEQVWQKTDYDIDGVVIECTDPEIKKHMGATRHHHRWQIAFKINNQSAEVVVIQVIPQTSRTGRISPVVELEPTKLSGAEIRRATAHHYQMVKTKGIGKGALIKLVRSGLVIPKIEMVLQKAAPDLPTHCPSCNHLLEWNGDNLFCLNKIDCPAQVENTMIHFFHTLGNVDGFGPATITIFREQGISKVSEIYQLDAERLQQMGYKEKTVQNLLTQLRMSREIEIEDWRFLSAFGVERLGRGSSERLLEHYDLSALFDLTIDQIIEIEGFAQKTASLVLDGLIAIKDEFETLYQLGFNLRSSRLQRDILNDSLQSDHPLFEKTVVFTGTMQKGNRSDMENEAKLLGAKVSKSVSGATDYLIVGEKVGATKMNAAKAKGVAILTEDEYLNLIKDKD